MASPTSNPLKIRRARLSFPRLWEPKAFQEGQKPRYEATFLLDPSDKAHAQIIEKKIPDIIAELAAEAYPNAKEREKFLKVYKSSFGLAEDLDKDYDGYEGMFVLPSHNTQVPVVIDKDKSPLGEGSGRPYAGCYVNGSVSFWLQDNQYGKRINVNLRGVQFVEDGEAFGAAAVNADEEFDDESDDDDDIF